MKKVYHIAIDHWRDPKHYPIAVGAVKVDNLSEIKNVFHDLDNYLRKNKPGYRETQEIKWSDLKPTEKLWLTNRIAKSKIKGAGIFVNRSNYGSLTNKYSSQLGFWPYKLFAVWYKKAVELLVGKNKAVDLHIDRYLENREGKPTREMESILITIERLWKNTINITLSDSRYDLNIQLADFIVGIIRDRNELKRRFKNFKFPSNIKVLVDPDATEEIELLSAHGARHIGHESHASNSNSASRIYKYFGAGSHSKRLQVKTLLDIMLNFNQGARKSKPASTAFSPKVGADWRGTPHKFYIFTDTLKAFGLSNLRTGCNLNKSSSFIQNPDGTISTVVVRVCVWR